jgi:hypothetical protein
MCMHTHAYMIYLNVCVYICGLCVCAYTCTHRYAHITYKALTSTYSMCMPYGICLRVHTHIHIYWNLCVLTCSECICVLIHMYICVCTVHIYHTHTHTNFGICVYICIPWYLHTSKVYTHIFRYNLRWIII